MIPRDVPRAMCRLRAVPIHLLLPLFLAMVPPAAWGAAAPAAGETVCIQCHGKQPGRLGAPVAAWRTSIHAANGISCHNCHGGDPTDMAMAMNPARGFLGAPKEEAIPAFCGRCHVGVKEDYLASAHGRALGRGGPQCVTCHGNHAVVKATPDLINGTDCSRCHDYGRAWEIKGAVIDIDRRIADLDRSLTTLHRAGIVTDELSGEIFALRNRFHRLFHNVDVDKVRQQANGFQAELSKIHDRIAAIEGDLKRRKVWGGVAIALLACWGGLALLVYRSYRKEL